jgi:hypothetical protein
VIEAQHPLHEHSPPRRHRGRRLVHDQEEAHG